MKKNTGVEAKLMALEAVIRSLHYYVHWWNPSGRDESCSCGKDWPCPTILGLENVLGNSDE